MRCWLSGSTRGGPGVIIASFSELVSEAHRRRRSRVVIIALAVALALSRYVRSSPLDIHNGPIKLKLGKLSYEAGTEVRL